ncbi:hypothetical protein TEA_030032 [Camellia sinensis var. sinensis]|uniref:Protein preY, mitochondrial n=1 Tax=Camellia sinensis var. sinensis TaxID=542762 RepID=A0A4S4DI75_CAMSN|nr:hypothetical protein TEA_030032 [Camellia sinensis var. sinensis]
MVRVSRVLLGVRDGGFGISKSLLEILVCPLSKQPLRMCEQSNSLISDAIGVAYPGDIILLVFMLVRFPTHGNPPCADTTLGADPTMKVLGVSPTYRPHRTNGIPCLVPKDGKIIDTDDMPKPAGAADSPNEKGMSNLQADACSFLSSTIVHVLELNDMLCLTSSLFQELENKLGTLLLLWNQIVEGDFTLVTAAAPTQRMRCTLVLVPILFLSGKALCVLIKMRDWRIEKLGSVLLLVPFCVKEIEEADKLTVICFCR